MNRYRELHLTDRFRGTSDESLLGEAYFDFWHSGPQNIRASAAYQEIIRRKIIDRFDPYADHFKKEGRHAQQT